jgi:WD40 repeat protein
LRLWDLDTGQEVSALSMPGAGMCAVLFSKDGSTLIAAGGGAIRLWDMRSRSEIYPGPGHCDWVGGLAFAPDGQTIATSGGDGAIIIWQTATGQIIRRLACSSATDWLEFAPDGKTLVSGSRDGSIAFWDAKAGKQVRRLAGHTRSASIAYSADGRLLASGGRDGRICLWDPGTGNRLREFSVAGATANDGRTGVGAIAFAADSNILAWVGMPYAFAESADHSIRLLQIDSGKEIGRLGSQQRPITGIAFSPDGRYLASSCHDGTVRLWEVRSGKSIGAFSGHANGARCVAFSPDGKMLASAGYDETIRLWETISGKQVTEFTGHAGGTIRVAFSPDGKTLASGGADTIALLWPVSGRAGGGLDKVRGPALLDLKAWWTQLASEDAGYAFQAMQRLIEAPEQTVALLKVHLQPAAAGHRAQIDTLIAALDDDQFQVRERAAEALIGMGPLVSAALRKALAGDISNEARRRIVTVLEKQAGFLSAPELLRGLRAIEVLEHVATPQAKELLLALTDGEPTARLTQEARASLARLGKQQH